MEYWTSPSADCLEVTKPPIPDTHSQVRSSVGFHDFADIVDQVSNALVDDAGTKDERLWHFGHVVLLDRHMRPSLFLHKQS